MRLWEKVENISFSMLYFSFFLFDGNSFPKICPFFFCFPSNTTEKKILKSVINLQYIYESFVREIQLDKWSYFDQPVKKY